MLAAVNDLKEKGNVGTYEPLHADIGIPHWMTLLPVLPEKTKK